MVASRAINNVMPTAGCPLTTREMRAAIIARGSRQLAAEVQALGKLTASTEAQALTALALTARNTTTITSSGSSSKGKATARQGGRAQKQLPAAAAETTPGMLSVQDAAGKLYEQLTQPGTTLTWQAIAQLMCSTGSPGDQPQAYQAALADAMFLLIAGLCTYDPTTGSSARFPVWLCCAVLQQDMYVVAHRHPDLAAAVLGPEATEEAYIR
jgi:hypothetical protein